MRTIDHFKRIEHDLAPLSRTAHIRFAVWSILPFTWDDGISAFIDQLIEPGTQKRLASALLETWKNEGTIRPDPVLSRAVAAEWDPDELDMEHEDASQGAINFLSALGCLLDGLQEGRARKFVEPAKFLASRIDYKMNFSEKEGQILMFERMYEQELRNQGMFISDLREGVIGETDIKKYHREIKWN